MVIQAFAQLQHSIAAIMQKISLKSQVFESSAMSAALVMISSESCIGVVGYVSAYECGSGPLF